MKTFVYDIECFKNFFCATFIDVADEKNTITFSIGLGKNDGVEFLKFMKQEMVLIGYNNHSYDDPMLRFLISYKDEDVLTELHQLSAKLILDGFRNDKEILELRYPRSKLYSWKSIDLMKILAFDKLGISLKQTAINLKWKKIQDLPISPDKEVQIEEVDTVISYNINDVLITKKLYEEIEPLRKLRENLSNIYHVDLSSASDSRIANLILENIYSNELKMDIRSIRDMRTRRARVLLGECIAKFIKFETPLLKELYDRVSSKIVNDYDGFKYSDSVYFANCSFKLGIGGLHTEDAPGIFVSDENYLIQDMDVASYYPNLIINNNFYPEHLGENFIRVLKKITEERLQAKKSGDKTKADGLKITVNSIFGKLGSETFWLLDQKQMLSTTVSGQLGLLMLIESLYLKGIEILSANTDGVVCRIQRDKLDTYYQVAKEWEEKTNLQLEYTPYKKYVRRDVNSYITIKEDGSTKEKGAFLKEVDLKKAYHMPIVAKALYAYYVNEVPIRDTLENCKDIMEFCISQKTGGNFLVQLHKGKDVVNLQKTNRFFISKKGGSLIKKEYFGNRMIGLYVGNLVSILNEYDPNVPFEEYQVDLRFYEKECLKIIDEIEPKQMSLFDISAVGQSHKTKREDHAQLLEKNLPQGNGEEFVPSSEKISLKELKGLGKNQLLDRIKNISKTWSIVTNISPRYVYIEDFDSSSMYMDAYCLSKGNRFSLQVDKKLYKKIRIQSGQLIYCTAFKKNEYGHTLTDCKIVDKIEEEKQKLI